MTGYFLKAMEAFKRAINHLEKAANLLLGNEDVQEHLRVVREGE